MSHEISHHDDIIDVPSVIERVEELRQERDTLQEALDEALEAYNYHNSDDTKDGPEWADLVKAREAFAEEWGHEDMDGPAELRKLEELLSDLCGNGGDEQWEGDWYPVTLIRDSHFEDYAQELAEDCDMVQKGATWPNNCIDWSEAARQLQQDYSTTEFHGVTYWYR